MLRRERIDVGEFRFRRIYRELGLQVRARRKRKVRYVRGNVIPPVSRPNERWSIDFMHERLANGRTIRSMNVVDDFTRECLALEAGFSFGSRDVIRIFEDIAFERGLPTTARFDNGAEFTSHAMLRWGAERSLNFHFVELGKPTQNAQIESLNENIRDELLDVQTFLIIFEARRKARDWKNDYNDVRPHSALVIEPPGSSPMHPKLLKPHNYQLRKTSPQVSLIMFKTVAAETSPEPPRTVGENRRP